MSKWLYALLSAGALCLASAGHAQNYPTKTITIVVTAAAGGVTDVVARAIGQKLNEAWGQQIIIENRGGGAHIIGASAVANAAPDGHTLMVAEAGTFVINPALYSRDKIPFDPDKAFAPITGLVRIHHAMITTPSFPANSVADVIAMAKAKPNSVTYGTAGVGSGPHVNIARLQNVAGIQMVPVHYRGATPSLNDVMGGHTNMMLISVSSALPNFRAGQVKMIGIGSPQAAAGGVRRADHRRRRQFAGLHRRNMVRHGDDRRHAAGHREENPCRGGEDRQRAGVPRALPGQAIV